MRFRPPLGSRQGGDLASSHDLPKSIGQPHNSRPKWRRLEPELAQHPAVPPRPLPAGPVWRPSDRPRRPSAFTLQPPWAAHPRGPGCHRISLRQREATCSTTPTPHKPAPPFVPEARLLGLPGLVLTCSGVCLDLPWRPPSATNTLTLRVDQPQGAGHAHRGTNIGLGVNTGAGRAFSASSRIW